MFIASIGSQVSAGPCFVDSLCEDEDAPAHTAKSTEVGPREEGLSQGDVDETGTTADICMSVERGESARV